MLKVKLLLKTEKSSDPYATLFNTSLSNFGYSNFQQLAKEPPTTMIKIANRLNHPFWSGVLKADADANIGFSLCNKSNLLETLIVGNPIFGRKFDPKISDFGALVYGGKKHSWT